MLFGWLTRSRGRWPRGSLIGSQESLAAIGSVVSAGLALAMMPWPFHPVGGAHAWLWAWAGFELAFLLPLVPPLAAGAPTVVRAAIREAQLGVLARAIIWAALTPALVAHADWRPALIPAHLLALVAALLAFPAAVGWGPFGTEESITPGGTRKGLAEPVRAFDAWAGQVRAGALLAAIVIAGLPVAAGTPEIGLLTGLAGFASAALLLRRIEGRIPRFTLPAALRLCIVGVSPLAALAVAALAAASQLL